MKIEDWSQTLTAGPLLAIAAAAIALLLLLIIKLKLHAFPSLILVSLLTALAAGIPVAQVVPVMLNGFGSTLASVALLVGLGAMLGVLIQTSGGAQVLATKLIDVFGEKHAPIALGVASMLFGFPIFFDAGLVVMLPIMFSVARWVGGSMLLYGLPTAGAFSVMHVFAPPHPGPVSAATFFNANMGVLLFVGLIVAMLTWYFAVYLFSKYIGKRIHLPVPAILGQEEIQTEPANPPKFSTVVLVLLLPMILIFMNTGLNTLLSSGVLAESTADETWFQSLRMLGETPVALLITTLYAMYTLGTKRGEHKTHLQHTMEGALPAVCSVILITGAGGMFGGVLRTSGIGAALTDSLGGIGVPLILAGFLISGILRIAQGSATVALTTTAGLLAPGVEAGGYNQLQLAALVMAVAAGSIILSHFNDSGFWLMSRFFNMDEKTTLKTWTVMQTLMGVFAFIVAVVIFALASAL
ncbi:GntP family permease [Rothia sp. ZJ932]|uniref:GntP family permease n=1 Tax=Rothia sp. ZJ932 TaxID=2810516 RepID=UPI0019688650|nr:GntP family permease [Rothia sp. ZJ932]QRZ61621.1 GntP family permease [Rothia sp. ZJ932]